MINPKTIVSPVALRLETIQFLGSPDKIKAGTQTDELFEVHQLCSGVALPQLAFRERKQIIARTGEEHTQKYCSRKYGYLLHHFCFVSFLARLACADFPPNYPTATFAFFLGMTVPT